MRRALVLANTFNLMAAIYFIIISIVALVQLRWYHKLTVTIKTRHLVTSATSYFAFVILIVAGLILIALFAVSAINLGARRYVGESSIGSGQELDNTNAKQRLDEQRPGTASKSGRSSRLVLRDAMMPHMSQTGALCSTLLYLISAISLVVVLVVWLLNTGELVRDSISTQLETALNRYQFGNRSNYYSIAIDGMQDINDCCGSLDYTDFPHHRLSGLSSGHYPGSCCGKNVFGVNARVLCIPDEIQRAKQTVGPR